jgi:hypothetical protein
MRGDKTKRMRLAQISELGPGDLGLGVTASLGENFQWSIDSDSRHSQEEHVSIQVLRDQFKASIMNSGENLISSQGESCVLGVILGGP